MNITLWVIASILTAAFLAAGAMRLVQPKEKLAASGMGWTADVVIAWGRFGAYAF